MDTIMGHSNGPIVGSHRIPDDIIIYILDFLESDTLGTMARASRHLQEVVTPTLYCKITIPQKEGKDIEHQKTAARLLRTLSRKSSLTALVRHFENAPTLVPPEVLKSVCSEHTYPSNLETGSGDQSSLVHPSHPVPEDAMRSCVNLQSLTVAGTIDIGNINGTGGWLSFLLDPSIKLKNLRLLVYPQGLLTWAIWNSFVVKILDI
ncbi:hypothetical protein M407DRAFT_20999 [Tulasnella calospora MUT 4182]|uniref:F-box domain-containing protein n=1 Tax=Tulasnella calospora MUT 4182 TaxID=1051891 RepID=A0A0C3QF50_9AGAM|nr:hypothetical protein M407DRAFT_20999 [Tulasnella calospora MUT 4182]